MKLMKVLEHKPKETCALDWLREPGLFNLERSSWGNLTVLYNCLKGGNGGLGGWPYLPGNKVKSKWPQVASGEVEIR